MEDGDVISKYAYALPFFVLAPSHLPALSWRPQRLRRLCAKPHGSIKGQLQLAGWLLLWMRVRAVPMTSRCGPVTFAEQKTIRREWFAERVLGSGRGEVAHVEEVRVGDVTSVMAA